jgi:DNA modification methylase
MTGTILQGDSIKQIRFLDGESVHCCITSPPYFGLRDYGMDGQIGLEKTVDEYVQRLVGVFREVRRVLRHDGTLWLNLGDSYAGSSPKNGFADPKLPERGKQNGSRNLSVLKNKDLIGVPWRVAFALQQDGWYLRDCIIWAKGTSGKIRMGNVMPTSVKDRTTTSHEYVFLLSKSPRYYYDAVAIAEPLAESTLKSMESAYNGQSKKGYDAEGVQDPSNVKRRVLAGLSRKQDQTGNATYVGYNARFKTAAAAGTANLTGNRRSVWIVQTKPFKGAHFATFPTDLIEPMIRAGCPERCCTSCGIPWLKIWKRDAEITDAGRSDNSKYVQGISGIVGRAHDAKRRLGQAYQDQLNANPKRMTGWQTGCACDEDFTAGTVLDPFFGAGTTGLVAERLGRNWIGTELNPKYADLAIKRIKGEFPDSRIWES